MTWDKNLNNRSDCRNRPGIVLLVTLVLLVMLSTLGYTLSGRIASQRHREQYIIDYQAARYGCDSAARYASVKLQDVNTLQLIERPNEPDFSDLFILSEVEYEELLAQWTVEKTSGETEISRNMRDIVDINDVNDIIDFNDMNEANNVGIAADFNDINSLVVRGPYGPPWPFVTEPLEFEIGSATVRIEIEDENAKYPLGWMLLDDEKVRREVVAGFETFCEWMDVNSVEIKSLKRELKEMGEIKTFKLKFEPIKMDKTRARATTRRRRGGRRVSRRQASRTKTIPATVHTTDFAKIFHSSLINTEVLARPTIVSESRRESALKYMGLWASSKVNINTAPRHVLETAFTFGGDADKIAGEIIQRRRVEPFKNIEDLKKSLFRYSDLIEKCEEYITTTSRFFTVRITAVSGVAKASTVIAITKDGKKIQTIAVISG